MQYKMQLRLFLLAPFLLTWLLAAATAQEIRFIPDFDSPQSSRLQLNGATLGSWQSHIVLRLTDGSSNLENRTAYFTIAQNVAKGFTTYFSFQMHAPTNCCAPGDGFAFILQNSTATDSTQGASGSGIRAVGAEDGGLGYSGINNSLAVEFDIFADPWDPTSNHVAIQTCGGNLSLFNSPVHLPGQYTIGNNHDVTSCLLSQAAINSAIPLLGPNCSGGSCMDGAVHQVVIEYDPPGSSQRQGTLEVFLDPTFFPGSHTPIPGSQPVINVPYSMIYTPSNPLGLGLSNTGQLFVGFGGSQPSSTGRKRTSADDSASGGTTIDILAWEFAPHAPLQITHTIPPGPTQDNFVFGGHVFAVTYPDGFTNPDGITMTVLATPWNQQTFFAQRLQGTNFADENCIIYDETGGDCIVYSVTCALNGNPVTCPQEPPPNPHIAICSQFYSSKPASVTVTDFLEAEPVGSNNWCSIWSGFMDGPIDPIVSGKGRGFSDIVATATPKRGPHCLPPLEEITKQMERKMNPPDTTNGFCPADTN
jgi:hypothetical protein